jgi:hypothetical protein
VALFAEPGASIRSAAKKFTGNITQEPSLRWTPIELINHSLAIHSDKIGHLNVRHIKFP